MNDVFGVAAAANDLRGKPDQARTLVKEHVKQGGTAAGCTVFLHEAPDPFLKSASEGGESSIVKNYLQQVSDFAVGRI
ncbi:hypothetical protein [Pseudomonas sp. NPDC089406]|uniref:hypothetical protein n=1 Tax=Pseudomonas sp. NPDC089406 TaxID=3364463 RepID=UPI00384E66CC